MSLAYAPGDRRGSLACLWALDEHLAQIVRATREGALGEIRLAWWREALAALSDKGPPKGEPLTGELAPLLDAADCVLLGGVADGWAALLEPMPLTEDALERFAKARGAALFRVAARLLGDDGDGDVDATAIAAAGAGWALADLGRHLSHAATAARARDLAASWLADAPRHWPRALRSLAVLTALARAEGRSAPVRLARAIWAGLTGR